MNHYLELGHEIIPNQINWITMVDDDVNHTAPLLKDHNDQSARLRLRQSIKDNVFVKCEPSSIFYASRDNCDKFIYRISFTGRYEGPIQSKYFAFSETILRNNKPLTFAVFDTNYYDCIERRFGVRCCVERKDWNFFFENTKSVKSNDSLKMSQDTEVCTWSEYLPFMSYSNIWALYRMKINHCTVD